MFYLLDETTTMMLLVQRKCPLVESRGKARGTDRKRFTSNIEISAAELMHSLQENDTADTCPAAMILMHY